MLEATANFFTVVSTKKSLCGIFATDSEGFSVLERIIFTWLGRVS